MMKLKCDIGNTSCNIKYFLCGKPGFIQGQTDHKITECQWQLQLYWIMPCVDPQPL